MRNVQYWRREESQRNGAYRQLNVCSWESSFTFLKSLICLFMSCILDLSFIWSSLFDAYFYCHWKTWLSHWVERVCLVCGITGTFAVCTTLWMAEQYRLARHCVYICGRQRRGCISLIIITLIKDTLPVAIWHILNAAVFLKHKSGLSLCCLKNQRFARFPVAGYYDSLAD